MKVYGKKGDYRDAAAIRGVYYLSTTKHGLIMKAWPRKRGKAKTPYDFYKQAEFAIAGHWATSPEPIAFQTAQWLSKRTLMVPRDYLVSAMYGYATEFTNEAGVRMRSIREVTINPQLSLDLITDEWGSLIWRSPEGWIAIEIGAQGDVLTVNDQTPVWAPPTGGSGGGGYQWTAAIDQIDSSNNKSMGTLFVPDRDLKISEFSIGVRAQFENVYSVSAAPFDYANAKITAAPIVAGPFTVPLNTFGGTIQGGFPDEVLMAADQPWLIWASVLSGDDPNKPQVLFSNNRNQGFGLRFHTSLNHRWLCNVIAPDTTTVWTGSGTPYCVGLLYNDGDA